jgi:ParB-like chromosome segregation protein Spo0J
MRAIDDLQEHPRNARYLTKEDDKHLRISIAKFGLIDKPIITQDGTIIGGHQRLRVLKYLGHENVECWVCDDDEPFTDEEVDELNIRLNKNTGNWDWDKLANEWDINKLLDWGFSHEDFDELPGRIKKPKVTFEFEDAEEMKEFVERMHEFPSREGGWSFIMKVKNG